ncbi:unnamed protein product [Brachionus calyciflorus]|uniref:Uncharacterized protein n=1 Tax=Brachionus calyciflorus TaxID=104777 RepID=A0A813M8P5_9BILA|nr:unnamed protein product [Brachionus calyciflorus]
MGDFLKEITSFSRLKLKKSSTKITFANGKQFIIENGEQKELTNQNLDENQSDSSVIYWSNKCGFLVDLIPDYSIDEIIPHLFLSGDDAATNLDALKSKNITHILNLTSNVANKFKPDITYKNILIYDMPSENILPYFEESFCFIDQALKNENNCLLVHCNAGVSRSSSFVIGYLMFKNIARSYRDAYEMVKSKRSKICPNQGFIKQLLDYEFKIKKK